MKTKQQTVFATVIVVASLLLLIVASQVQAEASQGNILRGKVDIFDHDNNRLQDHSNVVVFLEGKGLTHTTTSQQDIPKISHKGNQFTPHVLPIVKDGAIDFLNDDDIFHNAFSLSKAKPFDLGIYPSGTSKTVSFEQPGLVKLYCNIHPNMVSNILVLNNPFFVVTAEDGSYEMTGIPNGEYVVRLWSEFGSEDSRTVKFSGNQVQEHRFSLTNKKTIIRHKNKFGMPYRDKY